jgi:type VI protein secretion system component Hcp
MTRMMETLEGRQMFSVTLADTALLPVDTSAPSATVTSQPFVITKKIDTSSAKLSAACCTGTHLPAVSIHT